MARSRKSDKPELAPSGEYANFLHIRFNLSEVVLDFGQQVPDDKFIRMHSRIITSPQHLMKFRKQIDFVIQKMAQRVKEEKEKEGEGNGGRK